MSLPVDQTFTVKAFDMTWRIKATVLFGDAILEEVAVGDGPFFPVWMLEERVSKSLTFWANAQLLSKEAA